MSTRHLVALVARREVVARLRDRAFLISTAFLIVLVAASAIVPVLLGGGGTAQLTVATVGPQAASAGQAARALGAAAAAAADQDQKVLGAARPGQAPAPAARITLQAVADPAAAERLVRDGTADAALVPRTGVTGVELVAKREVPPELAALVTAATSADVAVQSLTEAGLTGEQARAALTRASAAAPTQRLLDPPSPDEDLAIGASAAYGTLFFLTTFLFGFAIAQSVVEEKQSRIVEILVAAVPVRVLLAGKVIGNTLLALGQIALFAVVGLAGAALAGQSGLAGLLLRSSGWFLLFFLLGFSMLACLWAAAGAVASRQEDLQATTVPLQALLFVPFFAATYVFTPGPLLTTLSYVPLTAPISMPRRLALRDAAWWEGLLAAGLMALTAVALVALATRVYERSVLRSGTRVTWRAALGLGGRRRPATTTA